MKLPATIDNLRSFLQYVSKYASETGFTPERVNEIELVVEEALVNIIRYAYPKKSGTIELKCNNIDNCGLSISIEDEGIPFDVLSHPDPELSPDIPSRKVGGLGVFLIKKMANDVRYARNGMINTLTLIAYPDKLFLRERNTSIQP
jgi:serine/threonine-protein kinase RsbW